MNKILGQRIKSLREMKGFTQEHLASALNCTRQRVSRIEQGLTDISYSDILQIAKCIEVTASEITSATSEIGETKVVYRTNETLNNRTQEDLNEMLDIFFAHMNLYNNTRKGDGHER